MYGFVDTIAGSGTGSTSLSLQTVFNGNNLDQLLTDDNGSFITLTVTGRSNLTQRVQTTEVPGMDGLLEQTDPTVSEREITIKYKIEDKTNEGFRRRYDRLLSYLGGSKKVLSFTDEDALFYATLLTNETPEEETNNLIGTITFLCSDPFKYGKEQTKTFTSDVLNLTYDGTAEASPIFELEVLKPVTFAMVQNQYDEYQLIGAPVDVDINTVDKSTPIIYEYGQSLDNWYKPSGNWTGSFTTTGDAIVIKSWGTGTEWHGAALMQEISPLDDYEIQFYVYTRTERNDQTYRVSTNYYDENMNELGMLRLWDKTTNQTRKVVEARMGPYVGDDINYLISHRNYNIRGQRVWGGIIRVRKEGNKFTFYAARVTQGGRHVSTLTKTYTDINKEYAGRLKYVRFDIANFGDTNKPNEVRIEHIKVNRLARLNVDQTPYIARPGDLITLDNFNKELLMNGEDTKNLKDFGGSFFNLHKGENQLIVHPANSFNTRVKWRDRYR